MNVGNILKVADAIEQGLPNVSFDMSVYSTARDCGTAACVAGHIAIMERMNADVASGFEIEDRAADFLGLGRNDASELFRPANFYERGFHTTAMAARVLRNLAITGKVDWEAAMKGHEPVLPPLPVSRSLVRV